MDKNEEECAVEGEKYDKKEMWFATEDRMLRKVVRIRILI